MLYKYLPKKYLDSFLREGVFLFRSLSYFQDYEDSQIRGDKYEGVLKHSKKEGIEINNLSSGTKFNSKLAFESRVDADNIFIFCTSLTKSVELANEFKSDTCVEIYRPEMIISKLHSAITRRKRVKPNKLFHREVEYYSEEEVPGTTWVFPEKIAMRKLNFFQNQREYRFLFSLNGALEANRTKQKLRIGEPERTARNHPYLEHKIKIGNISNWCTVYEFKTIKNEEE